MLIDQQLLSKKIKAAIRKLKAANPIPIESQNTINLLEDTLALVIAAAKQFDLDCFPITEDGCKALIWDDKNGLTEHDIEGLGYLAQSVSQALSLTSGINKANT